MTKIICTTAALSKAVDAMMARPKLSKNAALNDLACAIAGPKHDWGFLKNAPSDSFTQPGLDKPKTINAQSQMFLPLLIVDDDVQQFTLCPSVESAQTTLEKALKTALSGTSLGHLDSYKDITSAIKSHKMDQAVIAQIVPFKVDLPTPRQDTQAVFVENARTGHSFDDDNWGDGIYPTPQAALDEGFALEQQVPLTSCTLTARFLPEAWVRDNAIAVDPEGDTEWVVDGDEINLNDLYFEDLQTSRNAPQWVKDWSGPFTIKLSVAPRM